MSGIGAGGALFFALCVTASPALFLCVGVLTSQLFGTRRRASAYAATAPEGPAPMTAIFISSIPGYCFCQTGIFNLI